MRALRLLALCTVASALVGAAWADTRTDFVVIVHPANTVTSVERRFLADAFLKKITRWSDDVALRPVDLDPASPLRERFSEQVLSRSVSAVKSYWQQLIFSGRGIPPPELREEDAVVAYVLSHPGAIGYVSVKTNLQGARTVVIK
ncbi:MAG: substrate-binding domain-containing protein [Deltaproteobacteria bacterium]|nr:substrate-binding domain-containing protein [Deltaproteobacteria bacterium]